MYVQNKNRQQDLGCCCCLLRKLSIRWVMKRWGVAHAQCVLLHLVSVGSSERASVLLWWAPSPPVLGASPIPPFPPLSRRRAAVSRCWSPADADAHIVRTNNMKHVKQRHSNLHHLRRVLLDYLLNAYRLRVPKVCMST